MTGDEQLGIIKGAGYGMRDFRGAPGLWFTVYTSDHTASLQCFFGEQANAILKAGNVYDIPELTGRACYVREEGGLMQFLRLANI